MIKKRNYIYRTIAIGVLVILSIFVWNNYQIQFQERPNESINLPPQILGKCGIENCHGLDITCGPNIPDACTLIYKSGDICRQFASCITISGRCQLEKSIKFEDCKSCVEECGLDNQDDGIKSLECER